MTSIKAECPRCGAVGWDRPTSPSGSASTTVPAPTASGARPAATAAIHDGEPRDLRLLATPAATRRLWRLPAELAERPDRPAGFTADDLLDFHLLLQGDDWASSLSS